MAASHQGRWLKRVVPVAMAALISVLLAGPAMALGTGTTTLVSRVTGSPGTVSPLGGNEPRLSADGKLVVFESTSPLSGEAIAFTGVFVRDRNTSTTTLVSRPDGVVGVPNNESQGVAISADGRFVAFSSLATNLVPGFVARPPGPCGGGQGDIYLRDRQLNTTTLVSHALGAATSAGNDDSDDPFISADGRYVTFETQATDLIAGYTNPGCFTRIFRWDRQTDTMILISRANGAGGAAADQDSSGGAMSSDGRLVIFNSDGTNLGFVPPLNDGYVYLRDAVANTTILVSRDTGVTGAPANEGAGGATISANGRYAVFHSEATNLAGVPLCFGIQDPTEHCQYVYVRDLTLNLTILVSRANGASGAPGNDDSGPAVISDDGRYVAFESVARNFGSPSGTNQIYVRDLVGNTLQLVSRPASAAACTTAIGNAQSSDPAISGDGLTVGFESSATNLTTDVLPPNQDQVYLHVDQAPGTPDPCAPPGLPNTGLPGGLLSPILIVGMAAGLVLAVTAGRRRKTPR